MASSDKTRKRRSRGDFRQAFI